MIRWKLSVFCSRTSTKCFEVTHHHHRNENRKLLKQKEGDYIIHSSGPNDTRPSCPNCPSQPTDFMFCCSARIHL